MCASTGLDAFRADLLFFAGVVQTKTARQSVLSETSKTSGKWHCISMIKKIWTPQFDIINDGQKGKEIDGSNANQDTCGQERYQERWLI